MRITTNAPRRDPLSTERRQPCDVRVGIGRPGRPAPVGGDPLRRRNAAELRTTR